MKISIILVNFSQSSLKTARKLKSWPMPDASLGTTNALCCFITARKRSLRRLCFYTCLSFCPQVGGGGGAGIPACIAGGIPVCIAGGVPACLAGLRGGIPACLAGVQAHTQGELRGLASGVSRPTPRWVSRPTSRGGIPACTEADTPQQMATAAGGTHPTGILVYCALSGMNW